MVPRFPGWSSRFLRSLSRGLSFQSLPQVTQLALLDFLGTEEEALHLRPGVGMGLFPSCTEVPGSMPPELSVEGLLIT